MEMNHPAPANQEDERTIRMMVDQAVVRFNKGDATVIEDFWDENADYVGVDGKVITGRANIHAFFSDILRLSPGGMQQQVITLDIRFLTPELAIVDGSWIISGARDEAGNDFPPLNGRGVEIAQKKDGQWRFVATREMVIFKGN
jgi:uncharacterized protein (TIGR02246 family)